MSKKSASNNKAQSACQLHPGNSEHLNYCKSLYGPQTKPLCPDCITSVFNSERFKPQFKVYSTQEIYSISLSSFSDNQTPSKNAPIDMLHNRLESIIVDNQSSGYDANSLVYLPEKQLLVTCSTNGRVLFWSIGDVNDCVGELNFKGTITTAKYAQCGDIQYLLIVSENEIHIYDFTKKIILKKVLQTPGGIQCIEIDSPNVCAISDEGEFTMWNLETFAVIQNFKVEGASKSKPVHSIILTEKGSSVVLQDPNGVKKINLASSNPGKVQTEFKVTGKKNILGMHYLAKARKILVRVEGEGLSVLKEKDLSTDNKYNVKNVPETVAAHLVANEKEDQFLETTRLNNFVVYHDKSKNDVFPITSLIIKSCASIILEDQYRFVIADALSGTLLVYRTNQNETDIKSPKKSPAKTSPKGKKGSPLKASRVISGQRTLFRKHHPVPLAVQERKSAKSKLKLKSTGGAKSRLALAKSSVDKSGSKKKNTKKEAIESDSSSASSEEENVVAKKSAGKPILETFKESVEKVGIDGATGKRVKNEKVYVVFEEKKGRGRGASKKDEKEEKKGRGRSASKKGEKEEKKKGRGRSSSKKSEKEEEEKKGRGRPKKNDEDSRERSRSKSKSVARTKTSKKATKKSK